MALVVLIDMGVYCQDNDGWKKISPRDSFFPNNVFVVYGIASTIPSTYRLMINRRLSCVFYVVMT